MGAIKFYLDEHIHSAVADGLRRRGVDVLTVQTAGRAGLSDEEQLEYATHEGRVMVTMDADFLALAARKNSHTGIVFVPSGDSVGHLLRALLPLHDVLEVEEMADYIEFL